MTKPIEGDRFFQVKTLSSTPNPQRLCWLAAHQDYSEDYVGNHTHQKSEEFYGTSVINHCLKFGHWGVLEHPSITLACGYFPHSVLVQARTHRVGVSFDAQSQRYTSKRYLDYYSKYESGMSTIEDLEKIFYFRPEGEYSDRQGGKYTYSGYQRRKDMLAAEQSCVNYARAVLSGVAEEHARDLLASGYRQHFVISLNLRSALHFLDLRSKADSQPEIQALSLMIFEEIKKWAPEIASFYEKNRLRKARLSP